MTLLALPRSADVPCGSPSSPSMRGTCSYDCCTHVPLRPRLWHAPKSQMHVPWPCSTCGRHSLPCLRCSGAIICPLTHDRRAASGRWCSSSTIVSTFPSCAVRLPVRSHGLSADHLPAVGLSATFQPFACSRAQSLSCHDPSSKLSGCNQGASPPQPHRAEANLVQCTLLTAAIKM